MLRYSLRMEMQPRSHRLTWPLTFCLKDQYAAFCFYRSRLKCGVRSCNFHINCNRKNDLVLRQSGLDPRAIDPTVYVNLPIEIYQYQYVAHSESLNYGIITTCLRNGSAYQCNITTIKEQGVNGKNDVTSTLWNLKKNACIVPPQFEM